MDQRWPHRRPRRDVHFRPVVPEQIQPPVRTDRAARRRVRRHPIDHALGKEPAAGAAPLAVEGDDARKRVILEGDAAVAVIVREAGNPAVAVSIQPRQRSLIAHAQAVAAGVLQRCRVERLDRGTHRRERVVRVGAPQAAGVHEAAVQVTDQTVARSAPPVDGSSGRDLVLADHGVVDRIEVARVHCDTLIGLGSGIRAQRPRRQLLHGWRGVFRDRRLHGRLLRSRRPGHREERGAGQYDPFAGTPCLAHRSSVRRRKNAAVGRAA